MSIAAMWDTSVGYTEFGESVMVETNNGRVAHMSMGTFDYVYFRLDEFTAAMKENCIEYFIGSPLVPLSEYPEWFIDAIAEGYIANEYGTYIFRDGTDEIIMSPDSVILRNFKGGLRHMHYVDFIKIYDILGE